MSTTEEQEPQGPQCATCATAPRELGNAKKKRAVKIVREEARGLTMALAAAAAERLGNVVKAPADDSAQICSVVNNARVEFAVARAADSTA